MKNALLTPEELEVMQPVFDDINAEADRTIRRWIAQGRSKGLGTDLEVVRSYFIVLAIEKQLREQAGQVITDWINAAKSDEVVMNFVKNRQQ